MPTIYTFGKLQPFATVHRDERHGVARRFVLFLLALVIQGDLLQEGLQAVERRLRGGAGAVQRRNEVLEVADAVLGGFGILLGTAQLGEVADLVQEMVGQGLQGVRVAGQGFGRAAARACAR